VLLVSVRSQLPPYAGPLATVVAVAVRSVPGMQAKPVANWSRHAAADRLDVWCCEVDATSARC
jgi:hypothetical protein